MSASRPSEKVERSSCAEDGLADEEDIWSSRKVLDAICGSSGARGALRDVGELPGIPMADRETTFIEGMLMRWYAEAEDLVDAKVDLSGGLSRFDKNIEGFEWIGCLKSARTVRRVANAGYDEQRYPVDDGDAEDDVEGQDKNKTMSWSRIEATQGDRLVEWAFE